MNGSTRKKLIHASFTFSNKQCFAINEKDESFKESKSRDLMRKRLNRKED